MILDWFLYRRRKFAIAQLTNWNMYHRLKYCINDKFPEFDNYWGYAREGLCSQYEVLRNKRKLLPTLKCVCLCVVWRERESTLKQMWGNVKNW